MKIKKGILNPLNVLDIRYVQKIPKHFTSIMVELSCDEKTIKRWIYNNLSSRFNVVKDLVVLDNNLMTELTKISFEDKRESSLFILKCPYLENRRN